MLAELSDAAFVRAVLTDVLTGREYVCSVVLVGAGGDDDDDAHKPTK